MRKTDLEDIRVVIQRVRQERFPGLEQSFLDAVLEAEAASIDDDAGALRRIKWSIERMGDARGET
jgi:hypothetical protein